MGEHDDGRARAGTVERATGAVADAALPAELEAALRALDARLERAIAAAESLYGVAPNGDRFRGLYISEDDVDRLVAREPGRPWFGPTAGEAGLLAEPASTSPWGWLQAAYGLERFELDVVLIALAPEVDLRYERVYAYLQDDVTRRRPSVDLALGLLCRTPRERLERRRHFSADAPLFRWGVLELADAGADAPLLARGLKLDEQVVALLLDDSGLDARLAGVCRAAGPGCGLEALAVVADARTVLRELAIAAAGGAPVRLHVHGRPGAGKRTVAASFAAAAGRGVLELDLRAAEGGLAGVLALALREAWWRDAVLYAHPLEALAAASGDAAGALAEAVAVHPGAVVLGGAAAWVPEPGALPGLVTLALGAPAREERRRLWAEQLRRRGMAAGDAVLDALAARFRLSPGQIVDAAADAAWRRDAEGSDGASEDVFFTAARARSGHELERLAARIRPAHRWEELVLPEDSLQQLRELRDRAAGRAVVLERWGFAERMSRGRGIAALFAGPSGTGKTMAAEILAAELGLDLFRVDLAGVVSKYIGETEKNLDRVFTAAEDANGVLFFDEADALFGRRSEVRDSHDRYANIEISYLLQKMEQYEGIAILATNLRGNLDEAFVRRLAFSVHFPFPDAESRRRIWESIWPAAVPLDPSIDWAGLAARFELSGGNIRNIALAAAYLAAAEGVAVSERHLLHGVRREYQKMGKQLARAELALSDAGGPQ